jgi:hypothetical protein
MGAIEVTLVGLPGSVSDGMACVSDGIAGVIGRMARGGDAT